MHGRRVDLDGVVDVRRGLESLEHAAFLADYARPASSPFWHQIIADPQRDTMFSAAVYRRGGMTLQALREKVRVAWKRLEHGAGPPETSTATPRGGGRTSKT